MTRIVSNIEDDRSFSMKSIEIEFYGDRKLFERFIKLVTLWLKLHTSDIELVELLYISIEARPGISAVN